MTATIIPFNPLEKKNLGASVAEALLGGKVHELETLEKFPGAGIYAIYYGGDFEVYEELAKRNAGGRALAPIYIGKADPPGSRKGRGQASSGGSPLYNRLAQHRESIRAARNLNAADFRCRFLVVDDVWIPLGEAVLIARFAPVWNTIIDGFGNHTPGEGRFKGMRPRWDTLHPGRAWAARCQDRPESAADVARDVVQYLRAAPYPAVQSLIEPSPEP